MSKKKRGPHFVPVDEQEILDLTANGGLSKATEDRRRQCINVFQRFLKARDRPSLEDLCTKEKPEELEKEIEAFFQSYHVQVSTGNDNADEEVEVETLRPKGNTSLAYKSHLKSKILELTDKRLPKWDITDRSLFPNFFVS